jgi:hypothetical protein
MAAERGGGVRDSFEGDDALAHVPLNDSLPGSDNRVHDISPL